MLDTWVIMQVLAFGVFFYFGSYLTYRQRAKRLKKLKRNEAILV